MSVMMRECGLAGLQARKGVDGVDGNACRTGQVQNERASNTGYEVKHA